MRLLSSLLALALGACAATPSLRGPDYFPETVEPDVVLGYFTHAKHLGAGCPYDDEGVIDCFGPFPEVTLVVRDVIFGQVETARLELSVREVDHPERFPLGRGQPVLAYPERWGSLGRYGYTRLYRTRSGEWAMPVGSEWDLPDLPCSAEEYLKPHPVDFQPPLPTRLLEEYDDQRAAELRRNPDVTIRGAEVQFRAGILLSELYALRDRIPHMDEDEKLSGNLDICLRKSR
jgi:hypothetical protein